MNNHTGVCAFCATDVPKVASTCTGCGAMWGIQMKDGRTINISEYRQLMWGQVFTPLVSLAIAASLYFFGFQEADDELWKWVFLGLIGMFGFLSIVFIFTSLNSLWGLLVTKESWWKSNI